ncbi:MAG: hypothetical protein QNK03_01765 [Myxococcota bacterium]|nr:hypothetical protein [Myxococcota bacterium]
MPDVAHSVSRLDAALDAAIADAAEVVAGASHLMALTGAESSR